MQGLILLNVLLLGIRQHLDVMSTSELYNIKNGYTRAGKYSLNRDFLVSGPK